MPDSGPHALLHLPPQLEERPPCPVRCLVSQLASSTATPGSHWEKSRALQGMAGRKNSHRRKCWNAVQEGIWINAHPRLALGCALTAGQISGCAGLSCSARASLWTVGQTQSFLSLSHHLCSRPNQGGGNQKTAGKCSSGRLLDPQGEGS